MRVKWLMIATLLLAGCAVSAPPEAVAPEPEAIGQSAPAEDGVESDKPSELPEFSPGRLVPSTIYGVGYVTTRLQYFVADAQELRDLELLVVHSEGTEEPLRIEIRNDELDRRLGHGTIKPHEGASEAPVWSRVEWEVEPKLEFDGHYKIVVFSDAPFDQWRLLGGADVYDDGGVVVGGNNTLSAGDIGFRMRFAGGAVTNSNFSVPEELPSRRAYRGESTQTGWNLKRLADHMEDPPLPMCIGTRCGDVYATPMGTAEERAKRAKASTAACEQPETEIVILKVTKPELGFTCRDACTGHGYECGGMEFRDELCAVPGPREGAFYGWKSCDWVLSGGLTHKEMSCYCEQGKGSK